MCLQQAAASGNVMNSLRVMMHVEKLHSLPLSQRKPLTCSFVSISRCLVDSALQTIIIRGPKLMVVTLSVQFLLGSLQSPSVY